MQVSCARFSGRRALESEVGMSDERKKHSRATLPKHCQERESQALWPVRYIYNAKRTQIKTIT